MPTTGEIQEKSCVFATLRAPEPAGNRSRYRLEALQALGDECLYPDGFGEFLGSARLEDARA